MDILHKDDTYLFDRDRLIKEFTRTYDFKPLPEYGFIHPIYLDAISLLPADNISLQCVLQNKYVLAYREDLYASDVDTEGLFARAGIYVSNPQRILDNEDIILPRGCEAGLALNLLQYSPELTEEHYKAIRHWEFCGNAEEILNAMDAVNPVIKKNYMTYHADKFKSEPCIMSGATLAQFVDFLDLTSLTPEQLAFVISNSAHTILDHTHVDNPEKAFELLDKYVPSLMQLPEIPLLKENVLALQTIGPVDLRYPACIYNIINNKGAIPSIELPELS